MRATVTDPVLEQDALSVGHVWSDSDANLSLHNWYVGVTTKDMTDADAATEFLLY